MCQMLRGHEQFRILRQTYSFLSKIFQRFIQLCNIVLVETTRGYFESARGRFDGAIFVTSTTASVPSAISTSLLAALTLFILAVRQALATIQTCCSWDSRCRRGLLGNVFSNVNYNDVDSKYLNIYIAFGVNYVTRNFATPFEKSICADLVFRSSKSREIMILR